MPGFASPLDIANRALQHCGVTRIRTSGWPPTEDSKQASEAAFTYDKVRRAELRRNVWRYATRRAVLRPLNSTVMLLNPPLWTGATVFGVGSIVGDAANQLWCSNASANQGNQPGQGRYWSEYFGPLAVTPYDTTGNTVYFAGELVYVTTGNGFFTVYVSIIGGNSDVPGTPDVWAATTTYNAQSVVSYNAVLYQSQFDGNLANEPDLSPALWVSTTTYAANALVAGTDGNVYASVAGTNLGHNPVGDGGAHWTATGALQPWTTADTIGQGSMNWRQLAGAQVQSIDIAYPVGTGPDSQVESLNVFLLPNGFLRKAPQNPPGLPTFLGGPSGNFTGDWQIESDFLITSVSDPIALRFVADVSDVASMDDMFCEGLACRLAAEICPALTQSPGKLQAIGAAYNHFMGEARTVNAIEMGSDEPNEDDYITVRY